MRWLDGITNVMDTSLSREITNNSCIYKTSIELNIDCCNGSMNGQTNVNYTCLQTLENNSQLSRKSILKYKCSLTVTVDEEMIDLNC